MHATYTFIESSENVFFIIYSMNESLNKFFPQKCHKLVPLTWCISISYSITQGRKNYLKIMVCSYFSTHKSFMRIVHAQSKRTHFLTFSLLSVLKMASARQNNVFVVVLNMQCSSQAFLFITMVAGVAPSAQSYHYCCCVTTEGTGSENSFSLIF